MEEVRYELHPTSANDPNLKKLLQAAKKWLNSDESLGITVTDIYKDLFVAKLLVVMMEKYTKESIVNLAGIPGCTWKDYQFIMGKLVNYTEKNLFSAPERWTLKGILDKDYSSLLCFILDLSVFFNVSISPPQSIVMVVTSITTVNGAEVRKNQKHQITSTPSMEALSRRPVGMSLEQLNVADVYETLIDTPEKFQEVCELLVVYVNNNLAEVGLSISQLRELTDGSMMIILLGLLGRFFVPMCHYSLKATTNEDMVRNWTLACKLMTKISVDTEKVNFDDLFGENNITEISKVVFLVQQAVTAE